jgi:PTS system mannose-specific IIA component
MSPRMIEVIVMTHGRLAEELIETARSILGEKPGVHAIGLALEDSLEELQARLLEIIDHAPGADTAYLILADIFGGTPSNVALGVAQSKPLQVITGVNLAMVLEALNLRDHTADAVRLAELVTRKSRDSILHANALFEGMTKP